MKLKILVILICCLYGAQTYAQKLYSVKGLLIDTASNSKIDKATITVLNAKDSVLQKFVYSNKGNFEVSNLKAGEFMLLITYPDYADFVARFTLDEAQPTYNFGNVKMILKARLLEEVIIRSKVVRMSIKGDTTEFNGAAYATQKNAKVEDLLKQLNGMRINQKGDILFLGEPVSRILVDGEEFFSDDPALVSKTVRADMVNKIQVFDQKSEQAKLTGIDDGIKVKTINIVLTEDKRKGVFGKLEAGPATRGFGQAEASFSKFSLKQKFSAHGNAANTGDVGSIKGDFTEYGAPGTPSMREAGAHYDTKWNKDKQAININYSLRDLNVDLVSNNLAQNNLPGNFNRSQQDRTSLSNNFNQFITTAYTAKIDSTSDFRLSINGSERKLTAENSSFGSTTRGNGVLQNSSNVSSLTDNNSRNFYAGANYTKRLKKKGRTISVNASSSFGDTKGSNYLSSQVNYYDGQGRLDSTGNINQYKPGSTTNSSVTTGFSYTDQLSKMLSLTTGYSFSRSENQNDQRSFNQDPSNNYTLLDSAFSSDFRLVSQSSTYMVNIAYTGKKISANAGTSVADAGLQQTDLFSDVILDRKFINWAPNASLRYQLNKATSLTLSYYGNTQQPDASQLQQLRQNADPLNITLGNAQLKPSFRNRLSYNYRVYQASLDRGINFRGNYGAVTNAIVSNRSTDSTGVNVFQYVNLNGRTQKNWDVYTEVYGHATKLDFVLSISFTARGNTYFNFVNDQLNKVISVDYTPRLEISKNKADYNYRLTIGPNYQVNTSSLQQVDNNSKGFFSTLNYYTKLPGNFYMGSDLNYKFTGKNKVFDRNFQQLLINTYVGKSFLKNESLKLTLKANDLLNQNTGYYRTGTSDTFTEVRNSTIKRYFMFSATWDFKKFGKSLQKQP
ncbi:MAG: TonB-dependent receptor [Bacteroidota bacterium]